MDPGDPYNAYSNDGNFEKEFFSIEIIDDGIITLFKFL